MGDPYLSWHLSIDEGAHEGQSLCMISPLRQDMLRMFRSQLRAVGVVDEDLTLEWDRE